MRDIFLGHVENWDRNRLHWHGVESDDFLYVFRGSVMSESSRLESVLVKIYLNFVRIVFFREDESQNSISYFHT